jgi:hypothetical protein
MAHVKRILIFAASLNSRMKHFFILLLVLYGMLAHGQVTVTVLPADTTVCFRDSIAFTTIITGAGTEGIDYRWQFNNGDISGATDSLYSISRVTAADTGLYRCIISQNGVISDTSIDSHLRIRPRMYIDSLYRYNPGRIRR